MALFEYLKQVTRLLREQNQTFVNPDSLIAYINEARKEVAMKAQCIRVLTPISGAITGWSITAAGAGYSQNPTFTVSAPDMPSGFLPFPNGSQATASGAVQSGQIVAVDSSYGGSGYLNPTLTITDSTGHGATASATLSFVNQVNQGQEKYAFSDIDLSANPGCESVYFVRSISLLYNNYRYSLPCYAFSVYQSMIRQFPFQYEYIPIFSSQFGQGADGSFFLYPLPSQSYPCEWDCLVIPSDLTDDQSYEALPEPWRAAVKYHAAHLAFLELQNYNAAAYYKTLFDDKVLGRSNYARAGRMVNPYGRY